MMRLSSAANGFPPPLSSHAGLLHRLQCSGVTLPPPPPPPRAAPSRRAFLLSGATAAVPLASASTALPSTAKVAADFLEIEGSGGVRALDLRTGDGEVPADGEQVAIHYYGRLAAKRGWRFDSTYDHKDEAGDPVPFVFVVGSGKVISGINVAVKSMRVGGIRRVIIPPSQGYQNTSQEPLPPNYFDRQRLFTTIFNPTRLNNGEGPTLDPQFRWRQALKNPY